MYNTKREIKSCNGNNASKQLFSKDPDGKSKQ